MVWNVTADISSRYSPGVRAPNEGPEGAAERGGLSFFDWAVAPLKQGQPLAHPERMPSIGYIPKSRERFYPMMPIFDQFGVTAELKAFIESWEPGVHEFYPIKLVARDTGKEMPVQYYVMNICNRLASVVLDHPAVSVQRIMHQGKERVFWSPLTNDYVFDRDAIRGKHIWRDSGSLVSKYMSDEFLEAFEKAGFKAISKLGHYNEV